MTQTSWVRADGNFNFSFFKCWKRYLVLYRSRSGMLYLYRLTARRLQVKSPLAMRSVQCVHDMTCDKQMTSDWVLITTSDGFLCPKWDQWFSSNRRHAQYISISCKENIKATWSSATLILSSFLAVSTHSTSYFYAFLIYN